MQDLYQLVTDKIIASLESGIAPWVRPWTSTQPHGGQAYNALSGKAYRGINIALLYAPQYPTNAWMTYKQAHDLGAHVRKGERGSMIVFYKPFAVKDRNALPDANGDIAMRMIPLLKAYHVFNVAQIDALPEKFLPRPADATDQTNPIAPLPADALLAQAVVVHGGDMAAYIPSQDMIRLPHPGQFRSLSDYQATALHELTHWTGHDKRLARQYGERFGDQAYAREELVAEMGSAFLCAVCGIDGKLQHPQYIVNWLGVLKADKRAVVIAASAAQKAADFLLRHDPSIADESEHAA